MLRSWLVVRRVRSLLLGAAGKQPLPLQLLLAAAAAVGADAVMDAVGVAVGRQLTLWSQSS
jgi:hypothetical protein